MTSVVLELEFPARRAISSTATPDSDMTETNVCLSSRGAHTPSSMAAFLHRARKPRRAFEASSGFSSATLCVLATIRVDRVSAACSGCGTRRVR